MNYNTTTAEDFKHLTDDDGWCVVCGTFHLGDARVRINRKRTSPVVWNGIKIAKPKRARNHTAKQSHPCGAEYMLDDEILPLMSRKNSR